MPRVMILCTRNGEPFYTGLDLPLGSPLTGYAKTKVHCPHCHGDHGIRRPFYEGHGPNEFHKYIVALDAEPNFSAEVGVLISCFAFIESYVPQLLSLVLRIPETESFTIVSSFAAFSDRLNLLKELVKLPTAQSEQKKAREAVARILPRITAVMNLRNKYAHGRYGITFNDDFRVDSFISSRKPRNAKKSLDELVEDVNLFKRLICDIHGYIYRNEMPPA